MPIATTKKFDCLIERHCKQTDKCKSDKLINEMDLAKMELANERYGKVKEQMNRWSWVVGWTDRFI